MATIDVRTITDQVIERIKVDEEFAALVAAKLGHSDPPERTVTELIDNDEDSFVEFKSTARWDLREGRRSKDMEDSIVKSVAAFLNSGDGTLLIGDRSRPLGCRTAA
ncbi:MAG: ATP-binding protein [Nocardioidaceae bacterium]